MQDESRPNLAPVGDACAVEAAIELIGGKWKLLIVRALLVQGPQRFRGLTSSIPNISHKVLTQNLRDLEADRLLLKTEDDGHTFYALSPIAAELLPILHALGEWRKRLDLKHI